MNPARPRLAALALAAIVLLAAGLRFAALETAPPGLFRDEAEKGYNAWSLATTGGALEAARTAAGGISLRWERLPWMIDVMGAPTSAIYQYASVPFVALGGLSVATTRMAAASCGVLSVLALGLTLGLASQVSLRRGAGEASDEASGEVISSETTLGSPGFGWAAGCAAALWLACSVWHLTFSRWALEGIFVPLFSCAVLAGAWGVRAGRCWGWGLVGGGLGWMFYAYSGAQPFALAWGVVLAVILRRELRPNRALLVGVAALLIPVGPTLLGRIGPGGMERMARLAIWSDGAGPLTVAGRFVENYLAHLDPRFLFIHGDANLRHGVPGWGALAHADAILLVVGCYALFKLRPALCGAVLAGLFCGPIPAALTNEGVPHALRAIGMLVPCAALAGLGLAWLLGRLGDARLPRGRRVLVGLLLAVCAADTAQGVVRYFRVMAEAPEAAVAFQLGDVVAWERLARERTAGQTLYVDARLPYSLYYQAFYLKLDPRRLATQGPQGDGVVYYNPMDPTWPRVQSGMRSGDWILLPVAPQTIFGDAIEAREAFTRLEQKQ